MIKAAEPTHASDGFYNGSHDDLCSQDSHDNL